MRLSAGVLRRFVLVALVIGGAVLPLKSVRAWVLYEEEITYYNDAAYSQVVGTGHIYCTGRGTLEGTSSPFHTEEVINTCCGSLPC